jgi:hypothetical protein
MKGIHVSPTSDSIFYLLELKIDVVIRSGTSKIHMNSEIRGRGARHSFIEDIMRCGLLK